MTDDQVLKVFEEIGALKAGMAAVNGWLHTLDGDMKASKESVSKEMRELRGSVELLGNKFLEQMKRNGSSNGNGVTPERPPEPGDLTKEERGFWLAVGRVWKKLPVPARWAVLAIFLLGLVIAAPTLLRMIPGFKTIQAVEVGSPAPTSRHFPRATP